MPRQGRSQSSCKRKATTKKKRKNTDLGAKYVKAVAVGGKDELTSSTFLGLWVTVQTALDLVKFLSEKSSYHYLLTRRINLDALEVSFAASLSLSGSPINKHPFFPPKNI